MQTLGVFLLFFLIAARAQGAVQVPQSSLELQHYVQSENEVGVMENLMQNTTHQLEVQKQMRQLMLDFRRQKDEFAQGNQTKAHASLMVRTARQIYDGITTHHLHYLFSQDYLDELLFFSSIAGKNRMKTP